VGQACPTGNGEIRGPEAAQDKGTPLPGTRPERAAANNRRNAGFLRETVVADQGGFGTEDMERTPSYMGTEAVRPSDTAETPDLAAMGDGGETFGGV
jgi:hypothetical protein